MSTVDRKACPYQQAFQLDPNDPSAPLIAEGSGLVVDQNQAWFPCTDKCAAYKPALSHDEGDGDGPEHFYGASCMRGGFAL